MYVRLLDSALPIIQGQLPADRTPATPMDIAETIREGLQDVIIHDDGFDDGSITIRQDRPYPTHILGLYGEIGIGNI